MKALFFILLSFSLKGAIQVHSHRGGRALWSENTLPAFSNSIEAGVDVLELDVVFSKDRVPVIAHDLWVNEELCSIPEGVVAPAPPFFIKLPMEVISKINCGTKVNKNFPKQEAQISGTIPTLKSLFEAHRGNEKIIYNIETKLLVSTPELTPSPKEIVQKIIELVKEYKLEKRVIIQSFDFRTILETKKLNPEIRTAFLHSSSNFNHSILLNEFPFDIFSPHYKIVTKEMVESFHKKGVEVIPWTANDKRSWDHLIESGVDGIITDDPISLMNYLIAKKLRTAPKKKAVPIPVKKAIPAPEKKIKIIPEKN